MLIQLAPSLARWRAIIGIIVGVACSMTFSVSAALVSELAGRLGGIFEGGSDEGALYVHKFDPSKGTLVDVAYSVYNWTGWLNLIAFNGSATEQALDVIRVFEVKNTSFPLSYTYTFPTLHYTMPPESAVNEEDRGEEADFMFRDALHNDLFIGSPTDTYMIGFDYSDPITFETTSPEAWVSAYWHYHHCIAAFDVTYEYIPVPEPTTILAGALLLLPLGLRAVRTLRGQH